MAWCKVLSYDLGWRCNTERPGTKPGAIALHIEGPITEDIADLSPLRPEDFQGILEILRTGKTTWYESSGQMLITREEKPAELHEQNPAMSLLEEDFIGYSWCEDRYPPGMATMM